MRLFIFMLFLCIGPYAYASRVDATVTTINHLDSLVKITQGAHRVDDVYKAKINIDGTFNGCTIHWLKSTDGGTNKSVIIDLTRTTVTSTTEDFIPIELGWPSGDASTIIYASVAGCTSAPNIIIDLDDNLR